MHSKANRKTFDFLGRKTMLFFCLVSLSIFVFMLILTNFELRQRTVKDAQRILSYIDFSRVQYLTGTSSDAASEDYVYLKKQLVDAFIYAPKYKKIYFLGKDHGSKYTLYVDNIRELSSYIKTNNYSSEQVAFSGTCVAGKESTVCWSCSGSEIFADLSVMVSLNQEKYGYIDAIFVLDVSFASWLQDLFMNVTVFISFSLFLFFCILFFFFPYKFIKRQDKIIARRIMPYLFFIVLAMLIVFTVSVLRQQQYFVEKSVTEKAGSVPFKFNQLIKTNLENVKALSEYVANTDVVQKILNKGDREILRQEFQHFYNALQEREKINYFSFYTPEGISILRLHSDKYGDFVGNRILRKAIETRKMVAGAELDPSGDVVVRVVNPVFIGNLLTGFVEVGVSIENVISDLGNETDLGVVFFVDKKYISKKDFLEQGGTDESWNAYLDKLLLYNSANQSVVDKEVYKSIIASHNVENMTHNYNLFDFETEDHFFSVNIFPFFDVMGQNVGHIIVFYDYSDTRAFFDYILKVDVAVFLILSVFLFLILYFILKATDENIFRQQCDLLEREQYLSAMTGALDYGVIITDRRGDVLIMNPAAEQITGYSIESSRNKSVDTVFSRLIDETGDCVSANPVLEVISSGAKVESDKSLVFLSKDKREYFVHYSVVPIKDNKGVLIGTVLFIQDVTKDYKKAKKIDSLAGKLQHAINSLSIGIWEYDVITRELKWDHNMLSIYGIEADKEVSVSKWLDLWLYPADRKKVLKEVGTAVRNGFRFEVESRIKLSSGEVRYVKAVGEPVGQGKSYIGVNYDITEQKLFEEKIQQSERSLRLLMENSAIAISVNELVYDETGKPIDCRFCQINKAFADFIEKKTEDVAGKLATEVMPELKTDEYLEMFADILITGKAVYTDRFSQTLNCWYSLHAYRTEENSFAVIVYDISSHKKQEERLQDIIEEDRKQVEKFQKSQHIALSIMEDANSARKEAEDLRLKAEKAYKAKSQFLANMSHEIRTPMNAILGYSNLLRATRLNENQQEFLKMICSSGELLIGIIDDILDVSKFEAGRIILESIVFDLGYLCGNVMKLVMPQIKDKQIKTYIDFPDDIPVFWRGDPTRLRQVLINLLANAVKFTNKGSIGLSISLKEKDEEGKKGVLEFRVKDTGIGIARNKQKGIFEAFDQANKSITREYGGTGLGLAICKAVVGAMGGGIKVRSVKGKGSEFIFTLQLEIAENGNVMQEDITLSETKLKGKKVVILDSEGLARDNMGKICKDRHMDIVGLYADAKSFYRDMGNFAKEECTPELMLIDAVLSDDSGMAVVRALKANYIFAKTKFVLVTSDVRAGTAMAAHEAGFHGYLAKPFDRDDFYKVILFVMETPLTGAPLVTRHLVCEGILRPEKSGGVLKCDKSKSLESKGGEGVSRKEDVSIPDSFEEKKLKVLLAEDNIVNQKLMREYFKVIGFEFDIVDNGKKAVEKIKSNDYDLCFMDVQMPVMDGLEATRIIRKEISKDFIIVGISANVMDEHKKSALEAGFNDYLKKPVNVTMLKKVAAKWCT